MDHAFIITDRQGLPIAVCLDEKTAASFRVLDEVHIRKRPIVTVGGGLENLPKSHETAMKRGIPRKEPKGTPEQGKQTSKRQGSILEK